MSSTKPCCAHFLAGAISTARFIVPCLLIASFVPETVPGTPTARWP